MKNESLKYLSLVFQGWVQNGFFVCFQLKNKLLTEGQLTWTLGSEGLTEWTESLGTCKGSFLPPLQICCGCEAGWLVGLLTVRGSYLWHFCLHWDPFSPTGLPHPDLRKEMCSLIGTWYAICWIWRPAFSEEASGWEDIRGWDGRGRRNWNCSWGCNL